MRSAIVEGLGAVAILGAVANGRVHLLQGYAAEIASYCARRRSQGPDMDLGGDLRPCNAGLEILDSDHEDGWIDRGWVEAHVFVKLLRSFR